MCLVGLLRLYTTCKNANTRKRTILIFVLVSAMPHGPLESLWLGMSIDPRLSAPVCVPKNAPFPSIHERSAREKISTDQVAHVLNDEVSRKYIQSLKR